MTRLDANMDCNGDGYTNIEKYINGMDTRKKVDWTDLKNNYDTLSKRKKSVGNLSDEKRLKFIVMNIQVRTILLGLLSIGFVQSYAQTFALQVKNDQITYLNDDRGNRILDFSYM